MSWERTGRETNDVGVVETGEEVDRSPSAGFVPFKTRSTA